MVEQKLYKTRLCNLYQRGACHRQNCSFAHGNAELRRFLHGRQDYRGNDLREKLGRRRSPIRSYSPERDRRGRRESYGDTPQSFRRDGKRRKKENDDVHSDFSGSIRVSEEIEEKMRDVRRATSSESKEFVDEQLTKLQSEVNMLDEHKHRLEDYVEERIKESNSLTTRIQDLELQLSHEKEESKRFTSKIKKFVKTYNRQLRLEDELKRSRAEFERVCEQLGFDSFQLVDEEDPSDEEIDNLRSQRNAVQNNDYLSKKRPRVHTEVNELSLKAANQSKPELNIAAGKSRGENTTKWNPVACSNKSKNAETNGFATNASRIVVEEHNSNTTKHSTSNFPITSKGRISEPAVVFPSTSMAARAIDDFVDIVEGEEKIEVVSKISTLPFLPLPPPPPGPPPRRPILENAHDENVEIGGGGGALEETMEVDIV